MRYRKLTLAALLALCPLLVSQQPPTYTVKVRLVRVVATVRNAAGELIGSLNKEHFTITDNGAPQEITVFERRTEQPLSVSLLVDTSSSTFKDLRYEIESMGRFLKVLLGEGNPGDAASLWSFNYDVTPEVGFTRSLSRLKDRLQRLKGEGATSLYDALCWSAQDLEYREGRHVMVVVTDGGDTTSTHNFHQALETIQRADAVIYPILVVPITNDAGRNIGGENALATLAAGTGGRVFQPGDGTKLDRVFDDILRELRTQYLLGYYPRNLPYTKERFHRLEVKVRGQDLRVLARNGYYGD